MDDKANFECFGDPLMIIISSLELIKLQYDGVMDEKMTTYLNRIEDASWKIELLLKELKSKQIVYNK